MSEITTLICLDCGAETKGRQWWNKDLGTGICPRCAENILSRESEAFMELSYGKKGVHYDIEPASGVESASEELAAVCKYLCHKKGKQQIAAYRIIGELIGVNGRL